MAFQPNDVPTCTYDHILFTNLEKKLFGSGDSQSGNHGFDPDLDPDLWNSQDPIFLTNDKDESYNKIPDPQATITLTSENSDEGLFPGWELGIVEPFQNVAHEVTITTTPDPVQNDTLPPNDSTLEPNLNELDMIKDFENVCQTVFDECDLQSIDTSIQKRAMSVKVEPPDSLRLRYKSEGKRQIEKSRPKPMIIQLPNLSHTQLNSEQKFLLRLMLATYSDDPLANVFLHPNKLEYHSDDVEILQDETVCVPISLDDIRDGEKKLPRLSFVMRKLSDYNLNLTPLNLSGVHNNDNIQEKLTVAEAKIVFKQYNLKASRIICQLLIKQNETYRFTNMICNTQTMEKKKQQGSKKKRPVKSLESDDEEVADERPSTSRSNKRRKN